MSGLIIGAWIVPGVLAISGHDVATSTIGFAVGATFAGLYAAFVKGVGL